MLDSLWQTLVAQPQQRHVSQLRWCCRNIGRRWDEFAQQLVVLALVLVPVALQLLVLVLEGLLMALSELSLMLPPRLELLLLPLALLLWISSVLL